MKAVITGDIIGSGDFVKIFRDFIYEGLEEMFEQMKSEGNGFTIYRGESIQGVIARPEDALRVALKIKSKMKTRAWKEKEQKRVVRKPQADIRLSIGIGEVDYQREKIQESDGPAFQFSGRTLDEMKANSSTIALTTDDHIINETWTVILGLADQMMHKWTVSSAEIIYELLNKEKEKDISEKLGISQPAVNHRKRHSGWDAIKKMLVLYEKQINSRYG